MNPQSGIELIPFKLLLSFVFRDPRTNDDKTKFELNYFDDKNPLVKL